MKIGIREETVTELIQVTPATRKALAFYLSLPRSYEEFISFSLPFNDPDGGCFELRQLNQ